MSAGKFPFPILRIREKVRETREPIARFIQLGNLSEVILRYLAALTLSWLFLVRRKMEIAIPEKVLSGLRRPSFGHWCQILHALLPRLTACAKSPVPELDSIGIQIERSPELVKGYGEIQFFLGKRRESVPKRFSICEFFDLLAAFRNKTKAHGAVQNSLAEMMNPLLESALDSMLDSLSFLEKYPLTVISETDESAEGGYNLSDPECPPDGRLRVSDSSGKFLLELFPAAVWSRSDFWFMNGCDSFGSIEYLCYETGFLQRLNISDFSQITGSTQPEEPVPKKSFPRVEIYKGNAWDLTVDVAIMAQDRFRIFGPPQDIVTPGNFSGEIRKAMDDFDSQEKEEETLGDVILSRRPWCAARYLLEIIAYDLDRSPVTDPATVKTGLKNAFVLVKDLGPESLAICAMGVEYKVISPEEFSEILVLLLETQHNNLESVDRLVVAVSGDSEVLPLMNSLSRRIADKVFLAPSKP